MVRVGEAGSISWVCGEVATVEVEIRNPTVIPIKVGGLRYTSAFHRICCISQGVSRVM